MLKMMETRLLNRTSATMQTLIADAKDHFSREIHQLRRGGGGDGGGGGDVGDGFDGGGGKGSGSGWNTTSDNKVHDNKVHVDYSFVQSEIRELTFKVAALTQNNDVILQLVTKLCSKTDKGTYNTAYPANGDNNRVLRSNASVRDCLFATAERGKEVKGLLQEEGNLRVSRRDEGIISRARSAEKRRTSRSRGREPKEANGEGAMRRKDAAARLPYPGPAPAGAKNSAPDRRHSNGGASMRTSLPRTEVKPLGLDHVRPTVKSMPQRRDNTFTSDPPSGDTNWSGVHAITLML